MKRITKKTLEKYGACEAHIERFVNLWPRGVVPSLKAVRRAQAAGLDLCWVVRHLLPLSSYEAFNKAHALASRVYDAGMQPVINAYNKTSAGLHEACDKALAAADKAYHKSEKTGLTAAGQKVLNEAYTVAYKTYNEAIKPIGAAFEEAKKPLVKAFDEAIAQAMWKEMKKKGVV